MSVQLDMQYVTARMLACNKLSRVYSVTRLHNTMAGNSEATETTPHARNFPVFMESEYLFHAAESDLFFHIT